MGARRKAYAGRSTMGRIGLTAVLSSAVLVLWANAAPAQPKPKPKGAPKGEAPSTAAPSEPAVPAPAPPAWDSGTSTVGVQLLPPNAGAAPSPAAPPTTAASSGYDAAKGAELEQRLHSLETRLDAAEKANAESDAKLTWLKRLTISGYVQPQLLLQWYNAAASPNAGPNGLPAGISANDTLAQPNPINPSSTSGGITTNGDYFRLRRARLQVEFMPTDFA